MIYPRDDKQDNAPKILLLAYVS